MPKFRPDHIASMRQAMAEAPVKSETSGALRTGYGGVVLAEKQFDRFAQTLVDRLQAGAAPEAMDGAVVFGRQLGEALFEAPPEGGAQIAQTLQSIRNDRPAAVRLSDITEAITALENYSHTAVEQAVLMAKLEMLKQIPLQEDSPTSSLANLSQALNNVSKEAPSASLILTTFNEMQSAELAAQRKDLTGLVKSIDSAITALERDSSGPAQELQASLKEVRGAILEASPREDAVKPAWADVGEKWSQLVAHTKAQTLDYYNERLSSAQFKEAVEAQNQDSQLNANYSTVESHAQFGENIAVSMARMGMSIAQHEGTTQALVQLDPIESHSPSQSSQDAYERMREQVADDAAQSPGESGSAQQKEMELGEM